jgi:hypothetical protein
MTVVGGTADEVLVHLEGGKSSLVHEGDDRLHLGHRLGPDAVAGEEKQLLRH